VFAAREHSKRSNRVNLIIIGTCPFVTFPGGINPLLSTWGGEAMYISKRSVELRERLEQLGRPSIVVAETVYEPDRFAAYSRKLLRAFIGTHPGLDAPYTQLNSQEPIAGSDIVDIWLPGQPVYDQYPRLWKR